MSEKISQYTAIASVQSDDLLPIVDVHDTSMASTGTTKKITVGNLLSAVPWYNVRAFGAVSDAKLVKDGVTTASSTAFTSATAGFTSSDAGKTVSIGLASGVALNTTIAAYVSATQVTLTAAPSSSVSGAWFCYGTDSTAAFQNAFNAAGVVYAPGNYLITSTVTRNGSGFALLTDGLSESSIYYTGTGDCFRIYDSTLFANRNVNGAYIQAAIYCVNPTAAATGLHVGDILQLGLDIRVQDFNIAGCMGVHFDNAYQWTEQMYGRVYASGCTSNVVFDVTGATTSTNSFARADLQIYINQAAATYDGVVFQNGAYLYDGAFALRGNFIGSSSSLTSAVLRITGTVPAGHPGAGSYSSIAESRVEIGCEIASYAHAPATIAWGAGSNLILSCYGIMDFSSGPGAFAASSASTNLYPFNGSISGDATLASASGFSGAQKFSGTKTFTGPVVMEATAGTNELIVSAGGSATEAGAFVVQTGSGGFAGIYDTGNSLYYGLSRTLPAPSGTAALGGYFHGLGIGAASNGSGNPAFGVLTSTQSGSGKGNVALTVTDTNVIQSFNNTLDDGAGNMTAAGYVDATGFRVPEGSNKKQGTATLSSGSVVVANTSVTANSRIFLTSNADGGTPGWLRVSARSAGTSFTITSSSGTDASTVAYQIFEPG